MRALAYLVPALAAGCTCNQDYSFPKAKPAAVTEEAGDVGSWLSLDTDPGGSHMTMSYYDRVSGAVTYAVGTPVDASGTATGTAPAASWDWAYEKVDGWAGDNGLDPGDIGKYTSQKTAPDGTVWLAYQDVTHGGLKVAHRTGGPVWTTEVADPIGGDWVSLTLDAAGSPVISHQDAAKGALRITRLTGEGKWSTEEAYVGQAFSSTDGYGVVTERPAGAGEYSRIRIDGKTEFVAFYDSAQQQLVLLEGGTGAWTKTIVDGAGSSVAGAVPNAGGWPSILVEGGIVRIAYQDVGGQTLRLATRQTGSWTLETVDATSWRGADTEIFDDDGAIAIVYFDGYDNNQILAQAGAQWKITKLLGDDGAVGFHNEVVEVSGQHWVGSYDYTHHSLALGVLQ